MFKQEQTFPWLVNEEPMKIDFYLPDYNIGIECQGGQHFVSVKKFGGDKTLEITKKRDILKNKLCEENGVKLIYIIPKRYSTYVNTMFYTEQNTIIIENFLKTNGVVNKLREYLLQ